MATTSDLNAAIAKGAADAIEILEQAAKVIDGEWQRVSNAVAASDTVPDQVKQAVSQLDDAAASVRREAANVADDLPENLADGVEEVVSFFGRMTGGCASPSSTSTDESVVPVVDTVADVAAKAKPAPTPKPTTAKTKSTKASSTKTKSTKGSSTKSKATAKAKTKSAKSTKPKAAAKAKTASKPKAKTARKTSTKKTAAKRSSKAKSDKGDS